jgi:ribosomal protein S18 acetylase RimI-like enzyme
MIIRRATSEDWPAIWAMLEPVFRAGETYAVARDITEDTARTIWMETPAETFVAVTNNDVFGTYYIKTNYQGGAAHICNCGYVTAHRAQGRGVARALCDHSQDGARDRGYRAMQFILVLASNVRAVALWERLGFAIAGTLPDAFDHPNLGMVDAHVMWKAL